MEANGGGDVSLLLKVEMPDILENPYTVVRVRSATTADDLIKNQFANKFNISVREIAYYNLVLVYVTTMASGRVAYCLRTLKPAENIIAIVQRVVTKQDAKHASTKIKSESFWYFKDNRESPLDFSEKGDMSGNSTSEGEFSISHTDNHLLQSYPAEEKKLIFRRSTRDKNLWKRRLLVLADKLWCLNCKDPTRPKALCRVLQGNISIDDDVSDFNFTNCVAITVGVGSTNTIYLRATGSDEQKSLVSDLKSRIFTNTDNDIISMGEVILCDEVSLQTRRIWGSLGNTVHKVIISTLWNQLSTNTSLGADSGPSASNTANSNTLSSNMRDSGVGIDIDDFDFRHSLDRHRRQSLDSDCESGHGVMNLRSLLSVEEDLQLGNAIHAFPPINSSNDINPIITSTTDVQNNSSNNNSSDNISNSTSSNSNYKFPNNSKIFMKSWNARQLTFNPCRSIVQDFHLIDSISADIISCMSDIARFKELFRSEVIVSCRFMWQSVIRIFQKYILPQVILIGKVKGQKAKIRHIKQDRRRRYWPVTTTNDSNSNSNSNNNNNNNNNSNDGRSRTSSFIVSSNNNNNSDSNNISSSKGERSRTSSCNPDFDQGSDSRDEGGVSLRQSFGSQLPGSSNPISSALKEKLRQRKSRTSSSYAALADGYDNQKNQNIDLNDDAQQLELADMYWDVSSDVLMKLHRNIFNNIRRQIAGLDIVENSVDNFDYSYRNSHGANNYNYVDPAPKANSLSYASSFFSLLGGSSSSSSSLSSSTTTSEETAGRSSFWSWASVKNTDTQSPSKGSQTNVESNGSFIDSYDDSGTTSNLFYENPYINLAELFPKHFRSKYLRESDLLTGSSAIYEIIDVNKRPRVNMFDALLLELETALSGTEHLVDIERFQQSFSNSDNN